MAAYASVDVTIAYVTHDATRSYAVRRSACDPVGSRSTLVV